MRVLILASLAAIAAACTQETPAPEAAAPPASAEGAVQVASAPSTEAQIDWDQGAALTSRASAPPMRP